jgi:hypothetical protein
MFRAISLLLTAVCFTSGCASVGEALQDRFRNRPITRVAVQSFEVRGNGAPEAAFRDVTRILIDRGYDIKASNEDAGLVTTEYLKYASFGMSPPFDYLMQIRAVIRENADGSTSVQVRPTVREQNRLNAAAYTEQELFYFTGEPEDVRLVDGMSDGWMDRGLTTFMNVVSDVSAALDVSYEDVERDVTETPFVITWRGDLVAVNPQ